MSIHCKQHAQYLGWLCLLIILIGSLPALVMGAHYKVFLLGGQSNALGRSPSSGLPTSPVDLTQPQDDILFYYDSLAGSAYYATNIPALTTLRPGSGKNEDGGVYRSEFGAEVSFGNAIADALPGDNIAIIKFATGGTSLWEDWDPATGPQYAAFNTTVSNGLAAIQADGPHTTEVIGMLWHQGENDAIENEQDNYQANLTNFIADVRSRYGASLPFMIGEIHRSNGSKFITVADAQIAVAAADANATFVPATDLTLLDTYHFDAPSMVTFGERFASRYIGLSAAPTLDSISDNWDGGPVPSASTVTYTLMFSEDMNDSTVTAADFEIVGTVTGSTVAEPTETYPGVFTLAVTPGTPGTMQLRVKQSVELLAADGGALDTSSPITDDTTLTVTSSGVGIYSDDVEDDGTWSVGLNAGGWKASQGSLTPTAGSKFPYGTSSNNRNNSIYDNQLGTLTVAEGTYTVTFDIGTAGTFAKNAAPRLTGNGSGTDTSRYLDTLDPVNVSLASTTPTPAANSWGAWSLTYTVAEGASVIGQTLGFLMTFGTDAPVFDGLAFDNFAVQFQGPIVGSTFIVR